MQDPVYSIMVVDDHPIIHDGLIALFASDARLRIDFPIQTATGAMEVLAKAHPDLIIIDLSLGDSDGTYLIQKIHSHYPKQAMLVYSMSEERLYAERVAKAGARGYVMKTCSSKILKEAIFTILGGDYYFSPKLRERMEKWKIGKNRGPQSILDNLSNREMDIFTLIGQGLDTVSIGLKLNISRNTVDTHRINIKNKLDLPSGKALERLAYHVVQSGELPQGE